MVTVGKVYDVLNGFCPFEQHEPWDNAGLLVGNRDFKVSRIAVALDITADAVEQAHQQGAELIVSHHPVIFHPLKNVEPDNPVYLLAKYGISAICAHTCLDCANGGVNDILAQKLGLSDVSVIPSSQALTPLLRAGEVSDGMFSKDFAKLVSDKLCCHVLFADGGTQIKKVAVCGGAGGEFLADARNAGCQAFVTGEAKHHELLEAKSLGITLVVAGHYETENPVTEKLCDILSEQVEDVEVICLKQNSPAEFI